MYFYRKLKEIIQQHKEYPSLKQENKKLSDLNKELHDEIEKKDNDNRFLWEMCQPVINNGFEYEVNCGYSTGNNSYVIITENFDTFLDFGFGADFEYVLIDAEDGYIFGDFGKPVEKTDGVHFQNLDNIDPVLQSQLEKNSGQKTILRPTVKLIRIQKRSNDE